MLKTLCSGGDEGGSNHNHKPDVIEASIGSFGRWQCQISVCMALLNLPIAWFQLGIVFLAPHTNFWCRQPEDYKLMAHHDWLAVIEHETHHVNLSTTRRCGMKNIELNSDDSLVECLWGYEYDRTVRHTSIITEWNLVCGSERLVDVAQMILMFGVLIGNILFGILADYHGRKRILIVCIVMQSACGVLMAWSIWYIGFLISRFLMAVANGGTMITSFVICMEVVGGRWRTIMPILYQIPFGVGYSLMAVMAYFIRDWRHLQLTLSILSIVYIVYIWAIPESPRWLLATNRRNDAARILEKAAYTNRSDITKIRNTFLSLQSNGASKTTTFKARACSLFATSSLRNHSMLLAITWFVSGLIFYGFSQYLSEIGDDIYLNVGVGGLIIIPGALCCVCIVQRCGRRWTIFGANLLIAGCFFSLLLINNNVMQIFIASLGIIGLSISTPALYLLTGELYPTVLRNLGVGVCLMCTRIGAIIAPSVIALGEVQDYLPLAVFACMALVQSVCVLPLPEADHLPDTLDDIEMNAFVNEDLSNGNYVNH